MPRCTMQRGQARTVSSRRRQRGRPPLLTVRKLRFRTGIEYAASRGTCAGEARALLLGGWPAIDVNRVGTGAEASVPTSVRLRPSRCASLSLRPLRGPQDEGFEGSQPALKTNRPEVRAGAAALSAGRT